MRELTVTEKDCAQQLIKYLSKYMEEAPKSFFHKMLRKKNIVLNQKKADGSEKLKTGDTIRLYLAEETIEKFRKTPEKPAAGKQVKYPKLDIVYEDEKVIFLNKPAGVLSQKAKETDVSLTEALGAYLSEKNAGEETMFRAGLCNRLDRNTSGLILAGKTVAATQQLSELIAERAVGKYYLAVVKGTVTETERIRGYLTKNERTNRVSIQREQQGDAVYIETAYRPLCAGRGCTLLEVELVTGKSHQIRSHLASIGHPLAGDTYGHLIGSVRKNLYSAPAIIRAPDFTGRTFDGRRIMSRKDNEKKETKPRKTEETSIGREIWEYVKMIAIVVAVVVFVEQVIVINARIPSPSMENTIMTGDQIFGNRLAYVKSDPQRYDIVIFYYPDDEKQKFIKRVIGLPGETVTIHDGKVYINDSTEPLRDDFCPETPVGDFGPYEVPEGCYFMLGDNRNVSKDSRYWLNPYVEKDKIIGKAFLRYWPLNKISLIE